MDSSNTDNVSQEKEVSQKSQKDFIDALGLENKKSQSQELITQNVSQDEPIEQVIEIINDAITKQTPPKNNLDNKENINKTKSIDQNQIDTAARDQNDSNDYFELPLATRQDNEFEIDNNDIKKEITDTKARSFSKVLADYIFLLGRLTTQAITDFNGNIIIPQNTLITAEVVLKAFNQGRLLELTKYSKG
ncbi:MAG TPA: hypothetical protein GX745_03610 [Clostridiales bacterium]|nr:hypothetical protein [Clostridiales bacterium]